MQINLFWTVYSTGFPELFVRNLNTENRENDKSENLFILRLLFRTNSNAKLHALYNFYINRLSLSFMSQISQTLLTAF